jgi:hypothetical protein
MVLKEAPSGAPLPSFLRGAKTEDGAPTPQTGAGGAMAFALVGDCIPLNFGLVARSPRSEDCHAEET